MNKVLRNILAFGYGESIQKTYDIYTPKGTILKRFNLNILLIIFVCLQQVVTQMNQDAYLLQLENILQVFFCANFLKILYNSNISLLYSIFLLKYFFYIVFISFF